ncbi:unnamed protein product [Thlaspi arvense]|uniref:Uncharacterized protein n=1 Tax=Thlaspi arvense TaxID=13288 RepID=A0AAU9RGB1_THLAR|nr:unnamed protein product [Thlaspi arvense]
MRIINLPFLPLAEYAELTPLLCLGVGSCAGIIDTSATYPKDMVCGRLTVQMEASPGNRGIIHALSTVFGEEGSHALHKGWLPSVIVRCQFLSALAVFDKIMDWLIKSRPYGLVEDSELCYKQELGRGDAAGTVGQTVAYLLDVIHQRQQLGMKISKLCTKMGGYPSAF